MDLTKYKKLEQLILLSNNVSSFQIIQKLKCLNDLKELDLSDNPICNTEDYRKKIFDLLPNLEILDRLDRYGNEK